MNQTAPQMGPAEGYQTGSGAKGQSAASMPSAIASSGAGGGIVAGAPLAMTSGMTEAAPVLRPADSLGTGITAWQNNKKITALWSINQNRNFWVHVDGIGWKKLANNSDSAIVALTLLGSHAREKESVVNFREESDGMIREMYVW